jgi:Ser/Thr protein kinase RdoA (MazF antagonist)
MLTAAFRFQLTGAPVSCQRYGGGHINETYLLETDKRKYILQKINRRVFRDVPSLMKNIALVTRYLSRLEKDPRRVLTIVQTTDGKDYFEDDQGECWRVYDFITGSLCLEKAQSAQDMFQSGVAFGQFQSMLSGFPAQTLCETIQGFHDTPSRYMQLHEAVKKDAAGRLNTVRDEVAFALQREHEAGAMVRMLKEGRLPLRVTHNDTKLNNVMLDETTGQALCVIDLDTVMPGLAGNDFGDSIRFGASTALEDEKDLNKVSLSLDYYQAYARGFLSACGQSLTRAEIDTLPMGAKLMTLECGVRFLTDYLSGDTYFRIHRPEHNLDRCRTQFKLVADMEKKWEDMAGIIQTEARQGDRPLRAL